jgi:hypothetical protein
MTNGRRCAVRPFEWSVAFVLALPGTNRLRPEVLTAREEYEDV